MKTEKEIRLRKILNEQLSKGSITKKKHKKELEFIKQLKNEKK